MRAESVEWDDGACVLTDWPSRMVRLVQVLVLLLVLVLVPVLVLVLLAVVGAGGLRRSLLVFGPALARL